MSFAFIAHDLPMKHQADNLNRSPQDRLRGKRIGISISESPELGHLGLNARAVNDITVDLARRLLSVGATVVLGHNWRLGGVMEAIAKFAMVYRNQTSAPEKPLIINYLAAPDQPSLSAAEARDLAAIIRVETIAWGDRQNEFFSKLGTNMGDSIKSFLPLRGGVKSEDTRPRNLFAMRHLMSLDCDARIVIGGQIARYQGFGPGIIEELFLALCFQTPVLLSTALGGASAAVINPDLPETRMLMDRSMPRLYLSVIHQHMEEPDAVQVTDELHGETLLPLLASLVSRPDRPHPGAPLGGISGSESGFGLPGGASV
jgi:hypothetical protein